jgi:hypothetical protein
MREIIVTQRRQNTYTVSLIVESWQNWRRLFIEDRLSFRQQLASREPQMGSEQQFSALKVNLDDFVMVDHHRRVDLVEGFSRQHPCSPAVISAIAEAFSNPRMSLNSGYQAGVVSFRVFWF